jgi:hypothetical protein
MIISRQKKIREILLNIKEQNLFIIGCGKCAAKLHVGGEPEVLEMGKKLKRAGRTITGWTVLSSACSISSWNEVLSQNPAIRDSDALLVMSCGAGVSEVSRFADTVYPALDTESLGGMCGEEMMEEQCGMCGECIVWMYGGICPIAQCAKGLLNGPCGGALEGKCELDERTCTWDAIYERLKRLGKLEYLEIIHDPKDHAKKLRRK